MTPTAEQGRAQRQVEGEQQYRGLLAYVAGAESRTAGAYEAEPRVFRGVLALGRTLLHLFFETRAAERPAGPVLGTNGTELAYHDRRPVAYLSVFGKLVFRRRASVAAGQAVVWPPDAELGLPERCDSDLLREWGGFGSADGSFRAVAALPERVLGWTLSVQASETNAREDAVDVAAARQQAVATTLRYCRANAASMRYDQYLARGWPIGTGVVEGARGQLVKDRMEQAGMRWTKAGAHAILDPRAVRLCDQGDAYRAFQRRRQHRRR